MWLFTRYGFFSVAARGSKVEVRSRSQKHLQNLMRRFGLQETILVLPNRDYQFRIVLLKVKWATMVKAMASEQTWSNFKKEATRVNNDAAYINLLHEIWWATMCSAGSRELGPQVALRSEKSAKPKLLPSAK